MMRSRDGDPVAWIILIIGVCLVCLCAWAWAILGARAEGVCGQQDWDCNGTRWVPTLDGEELEWEDLTKEECISIILDLDWSFPMYMLDCVEKPAYRTKS